MTAQRISLKPVVKRLAFLRMETLAFAVVSLGAAGAAMLSFSAPAKAPNASASATVQLPAGKAEALVAVTGGTSAAEIGVTGDRAQMINASLPFSTAPIQSARPFEIDDAGVNHRRALLCLTQAVYYEAGFEPIDGRRAVAQVVLNRMRHPAFPKSVCGVVYQGARAPVCQFSFVCDGSLYRRPAAAAWKSAEAIAREALAGRVEQSVGSATHYHADYVAPRWAPMLTKITKLGAHIFYRWPGSWGQRGAFTGRYIGEPQDPLALRPPLRQAIDIDDAVTVEQVIASGPVTDGTILKRAPNDVGGLLDTSKGWTLNIPAPNEASSATARALAQQKSAPAKPAAPVAEPAAAVAVTASPALASR